MRSARQIYRGGYYEFGVFSGRTINRIAEAVPDRTVYGFDSFDGLPEDWRSGFTKGTFKTDILPSVRENVKLIRGLFEDTLPGFVREHPEPCAFIHVDCDLYSSARTVLSHLREKIVPGTVIVFDEYFNYPGWREGEYKAFQEFIKTTGLRYEYLAYVEIHEQAAVRIL